MSYNTTDGTTLARSNEAKYKCSEPSYYFTRIDAPMIDLIDDIEDKCDSQKEDAIFLARRSFKYIALELENYLILQLNLFLRMLPLRVKVSFKENFDLPEPFIGMKQMSTYAMLIKYLEIIDIDEPLDNL